MLLVLSFYSIIFFSLSPAVVAILQNVTINSAALGIEYIPQRAWNVSTDSHATGGSFAQSGAENATVVFNITSPSTALFWHGFLPRTAARYSICIDCANPEALGSVVTIQTGSQSKEPVILFASKPLDNTTHSIAIRNLRNSIEGVVGVISLDSFSFTTDVEAPTANPITAPTTSSANPSIGSIVGIVIASVVAAGILIALAKFCTRRRRQEGSNSSTKRPKIWRIPCISPGISWMRHGRTVSSESSPIIEAIWKSKPLTILDELPMHNDQTQHTNPTNTTRWSNATHRKSGVPVITITSPSTMSISGSSYSTTHQDAARQSDPYASYAAAYASFAGVTNHDDDGGQSTDQQHGNHRQQSALRDSSLLPLAQIQERTLQSRTDTNRPTIPHANSSSQSQLPPSSFKGQRIRDGKKGTRTLSDKIKRGTLPTPPELEEKTLRVSVNLAISNPDTAEGKEGVKKYLLEGDLSITTKSKEIAERKDDRPSILPTFSSDSSTPSVPVEKSNTLHSVPSETVAQTLTPNVAANPSLTEINTVDPTFWSSYGDFSMRETTEDLGQVAESSSDGVESTLEGSERIQSRPQSLQARSSPSTTNIARRPSKSESGSSKERPNPKPFASSLSIMTFDTSNTRTPRSSLFSITPSVSDFPMPPFKQASSARNSSRKSSRLSTTASDSNNSASAFTDLLASTPSLSPEASGSASASTASSRPRINAVREKSPLSAFTAAARPKRAKAPGFRVSRDRASASSLSVPLLEQTRTPARRGSSRSSKGSKRRSKSPGPRRLQLPIRGNALSPPLPNAKVAPRRIVEISQAQKVEAQDDASRQSTRSDTTGEMAGSDVPFYMRMLVTGSSNDSALETNGQQQQRSASPLTMASTLTPTDEEFAGGVQLVMARRLSVVPDLPKPVLVSHLTATHSATSLRPDVPGSSNGQWKMVVPKERAQPTGMPNCLSISTDRNRYHAVNVPVSARTDMFEAGASEMGGISTEPVIGFGSGMGMPWSPNFDWPASPALNLTSPMLATSPMPSAILSSKEQPYFMSGSSRMYDYPTSVSESTAEAWNNSRTESIPPDSPPISQGTLASGENPGWKDIIGGSVSGSQRKSGPGTRDSTYSIASSSFFGGARSSHHSPVTIPPVPPMPPPAPTATPSHKPVSPINTRQGWHARTSSSQSPIKKQRCPRQRQTGNIAVGGVNSIFATPQCASTRPKLSLQRVEAFIEATANGTPISRYNSPYTGYLSPPSSAEPLISKR